MGNNGSPRSNSTQTVAPTRGKALPIFFEQLVDGKQGSAQPSTSSPAKSGATNWIRPSRSGSIVLITIARYFPKYFALTLASASAFYFSPCYFLLSNTLLFPDQSFFQLRVRRILPDPAANQLTRERLVPDRSCLLPTNHEFHSIRQEMIRHGLPLLHVLEQTLQLADVRLELRATGHAILLEPFLERIRHLLPANVAHEHHLDALELVRARDRVAVMYLILQIKSRGIHVESQQDLRRSDPGAV